MYIHTAHVHVCLGTVHKLLWVVDGGSLNIDIYTFTHMNDFIHLFNFNITGIIGLKTFIFMIHVVISVST